MQDGVGTRVRILRAAAALFRQQGFKATSMQDIAARVGITKSSLYHHIRSKQELLYEILQHTVDHATVALRGIAEADLPAAERLRQAVTFHVVQLIHDQDNVACFIEEGRSLDPEHRRAYIAKRDRYEGCFRQIIEEGIRRGEFWPADVRLASLAVLGLCNWVARWYRPDGEFRPEEIAAQFSELAVRALARGERFPLEAAFAEGDVGWRGRSRESGS